MCWLRNPAVIAVMVILLAGGAVLAAGSLRYGGFEGLRLRARVAMASHSLPAEHSLPRPATRTPKSASVAIDLPPSATPIPPVSPALPATVAEPAGPSTPVPTEIPNEISAPLPTAIALAGLRHAWQTWNNCGPATLAMNLSYYGSTLGQEEIGAALRRSPDDKNVGPEELAHYARGQGFLAVQRVNGDANLVRELLDAGIPVFIETWLEEHPNDGMGHYRLITGYAESRQQWIAHDSYISTNLVAGDGGELGTYAGIWLPYEETDALWKVFNRTYLVVYPSGKAPAVDAILGERVDDAAMWAAAEARARAEIAARPDDAFAWFNLGSSLWSLGRADEAADAFDRARVIGLPWRMLWYQFAPFATYVAVNRPEETLLLADATLANTQSIEEIWYWKGRALAALGDVEGARAAWQQALALYPGYAAANEALAEPGM